MKYHNQDKKKEKKKEKEMDKREKEPIISSV